MPEGRHDFCRGGQEGNNPHGSISIIKEIEQEEKEYCETVSFYCLFCFLAFMKDLGSRNPERTMARLVT
jgi:hypothetical protein